MGGRKKGTRNLITREHKMALREAVDRVGSDDAGKDGAFGYLFSVARRDPSFFLSRYLDSTARLGNIPSRDRW